MTVSRDTERLIDLFRKLCAQGEETEWVEFKRDYAKPQVVGEYLSALANSAALLGRANAYMLWGVEDGSHVISGTRFRPSKTKVGNEQLENWLRRLLEPKVDFQFHELKVDGSPVVLLKVMAAFSHPVRFGDQEFIRIGAHKKKLRDNPEKEKELWSAFDRTPFEKRVAAENLSDEEVSRLLDYPSYFSSLKLPLPRTLDAVLASLQDDGLVVRNDGGKWDVTNLGAILFASKLGDFGSVWRKAVRVIVYKGDGRDEAVREKEFTKGYACGFEDLVDHVLSLLPSNEVIGQALRKEVPMFPDIAVRELIANALIHQQFEQTGTGPMIELFPKRMEIASPGVPLVGTDRFLDSTPKSRNESLASFMRRIGICEERGTGIDKVVIQTEVYQLPAPAFEATDSHTRCFLFAHREFKHMAKQDKIRATYLHSCLRYVKGELMTNSSLRKRFGIDDSNSSMVSRIIKDAVDAGKIRQHENGVSRKFMRYEPFWA